MKKTVSNIAWRDGKKEVYDAQARMVASASAVRRVLLADGVLDQVEAIALSDPDAAIEWEYSATYSRLSDFVVSMGEANGFTPEYIDSVFTRAMRL